MKHTGCILVVLITSTLALVVGVYILNLDVFLVDKLSHLKMRAYGENLSASLNEQVGVVIPKESDWVDYGSVLETGAEGDWDYQWAGATPASMVKKDGMYYLYYVAGDGYRSHDGSPRHRAIGVATSLDGIHFTKYADNPIMTHRPLNGEEEGANSAGIYPDSNGNFVMYYGAAKGAGSLISADGRVAVSYDGFNYTDEKKVLNHSNPFLYGFGDEIFPLATFQNNNKWYVYYVPNGVPATGTLGIAWGRQYNKLYRSIQVLGERDGDKPFSMWGNVVWLSPDVIALFIQRSRWPDTYIEVRFASPATPHRLTEPLERYDIPNLKRGTVFLDIDRKTWFMYYNDFDQFWDVKLAPVGDPDYTPPSKPGNLVGRTLDHGVVELSWESSTDPDTGVVIYNIYRNDEKVGSTKGYEYKDMGLEELKTYSYHVTAVNFHGVEGSSSEISIRTSADEQPPEIDNVTTGGDPAKLVVTFSEPVDHDSAVNISNYLISDGVRVTKAVLIDPRTVLLNTSPHRENFNYILTVEGIFDRAAEANIVNPGSQLVYTHSSIAGLVGYWKLDGGNNSIAYDVSGFENNGSIHGASWGEGVSNEALYFDGVDDYVFIENYPSLRDVTNSSFTFSAWAKPEVMPTQGHPFGIIQRVSWYPPNYFGLSYDVDQKYHAKITHSPSESSSVLSSSQMKPSDWHHLAMVVDDSEKLMYFYVDGKAVTGSPISYSEMLTDLDAGVSENQLAGEYYIGSNKPDRGAGSFYTQHFGGKIDDILIYKRALTPEEICRLYRSVGAD